MNDTVAIYDPAEVVGSMVTLTSAAITYVKKELQKQGALGMRLSVKQSGCSGFSYVVDYVLVEAPQGDEVLVVDDGLTIYVDRTSLPFLRGIQIDCVRSGLNTTLKFSNPNEKGSCGCGESFTV